MHTTLSRGKDFDVEHEKFQCNCEAFPACENYARNNIYRMKVKLFCFVSLIFPARRIVLRIDYYNTLGRTALNAGDKTELAAILFVLKPKKQLLARNKRKKMTAVKK